MAFRTALNLRQATSVGTSWIWVLRLLIVTFFTVLIGLINSSQVLAEAPDEEVVCMKKWVAFPIEGERGISVTNGVLIVRYTDILRVSHFLDDNYATVMLKNLTETPEDKYFTVGVSKIVLWKIMRCME